MIALSGKERAVRGPGREARTRAVVVSTLTRLTLNADIPPLDTERRVRLVAAPGDRSVGEAVQHRIVGVGAM